MRDPRQLAVSIVHNPHPQPGSLVTLARAYLDLLQAADDYFRQSLPYTGDPDAFAAGERLRGLLPKVGERA